MSVATDLALVTTFGETVRIWSDPVSLRGYDRVTASFRVPVLWIVGTPPVAEISYQLEVSMDGTHWANGLPQGSSTSPHSAPKFASDRALGAFLRVRFELELTSGSTGDMGGVAVDLHLLLNHA